MSKKSSVFLRTAYNYDMNEASDETGLDCSVEESMTQQSFRDECDINTIVKRFGLTGELPTNFRTPQYGDFDNVMDYQTALNAVRQAGEAFMEMPAELRARFNHDPQQLMDFVAKESNREEAERLGLVPKKAVQAADALLGAKGIVPPANNPPKADAGA